MTAYKAYEVNENGIEILDKRKVTLGTIVPDYVIDLYLPIIKFVGLGFLTTLYRMTKHDESHNLLHDYMDAGAVGFEKLTHMLEVFQVLGFCEVEKPKGINKVKHFRTSITLLDPPLKVPDEYVELVRKKTIAKWLFRDKVSTGNESDEGENLFVQQTIIEDKKPTTRKKKDDSVVRLITEHYKSLLSPARQAAFNYSVECPAAKRLEKFASQMAWTTETLLEAVEACWRWKEEDDFWAGRVNLHIVHRFIANWVDRNPKFNTPTQAEQEASFDPLNGIDQKTLHPNWRKLTPNDEAFWEIGTRLPCDGGTMVVVEFDGKRMYWNEQTDTKMFERT